MVVGAADQNARLRDAHVRHQLEVLGGGPDPGGDLREAQAQLPALVQGLPVLLAVDEELRLADDALGAAEPAHELVEVHDLLHGEGLHGLLPVPEGGVGDPDLLGHVHGHPAVVEGDLRGLLVAERVPVELGLRHVLELVLVGFLFQQMGRVGKLKHGRAPPCIIVYNYTLCTGFVKRNFSGRKFFLSAARNFSILKATDLQSAPYGGDQKEMSLWRTA